MIDVVESIPKKVPGQTSLLIMFDYDSKIVDVLKQCQPAVFHKSEKQWEIPLTRFSKFINLASRIDDIRIRLIPDWFMVD